LIILYIIKPLKTKRLLTCIMHECCSLTPTMFIWYTSIPIFLVLERWIMWFCWCCCFIIIYEIWKCYLVCCLFFFQVCPCVRASISCIGKLTFVLQLTMFVQWCTLQKKLYSKNIGCWEQFVPWGVMNLQVLLIVLIF